MTPETDDRVSYLTPARELASFRFGAARADIRGWPVYASDGRLVGAVRLLMVESATGKVRYASVSLARDAAGDDAPHASGSVLVPIGLVRRRDDRRAIELDAITSRMLVGAPRLHARPVTRADEHATLAAYGIAPSHHPASHALYHLPQFDERGLMLGAA